MTRIAWREPGSRTYETGLDRGVLFPVQAGWAGYLAGVPWNGLVAVNEQVSGGEVESFYYDGVKYMEVILYEDFLATLEAYDAPQEFSDCDGSYQVAAGMFVTQQPRRPFGLSYRTGVGNDLSEEAGTKLHFLYNCMASPAERIRKTRSETVEAPTTSWTINTRPTRPGVYGGETYKPTAHVILDTRVEQVQTYLEVIENAIYGNTSTSDEAWLPSQQNFINLLNTGFWT